jgi:hypothetical protein
MERQSVGPNGLFIVAPTHHPCRDDAGDSTLRENGLHGFFIRNRSKNADHCGDLNDI